MPDTHPPLYHLQSYTNKKTWLELIHRVGLAFLLILGTIGVIALSASAESSGLQTTEKLFSVGGSLVLAISTTLYMTLLEHPNVWVRRCIGISPVLLLGFVFVFV